MSVIKADSISSNRNSSNSPVIFPYGMEIGAGYALTCAGGMNISGVCTAFNYSGSGALLTNLAGITISKTFAFTTIL